MPVTPMIGSRKKKATALIVAIGVAFYGNVGVSTPLQATTKPTDFVQDEPLNLFDLSIPKEIGSIKETFKGRDEKVVFVIQDAHGIPDAQRNIQKLIDYLQTQYRIRLVALEGAASNLDPQIFKSFPDQTLLRKVFEQYFDRGELAAGTAGAIFNPSPAIYHGVEDWNLYEEGLRHFLDAMDREESVTQRLGSLFEDLKQEKEKHYSKELLEIDLALQAFRKNATNLISLLEKLSAVRPPEKESELALLLEEIRRSRENHTSIEIEVKGIAERIQRFLKQQYSAEARQDLIEFNKKFQELQTQRTPPEAFALFLKGLAMKYRIQVKVSRRLKDLVGNQKRMRDIQGTKLFDDLEKYAQSVKEVLFQSDEERRLDARSRQLELMERLAKLELSREDWNEVKEIFNQIQYWNVTKNGITGKGQIAELFEEMRPQISFYHNAGKRDHAFVTQIDSLFKKHKTKSAAFIAGGFHAEGVTYALKSKGISYCLVMPKIGQVPDEIHYRDHMKGEVSWSNYFEVRNGRVNLYNAFVRGTRDLLLKLSKEERGKILNSWRNKIIRDLAEKGRLTEAREYTRFIDEVTQGTAPDGDLIAQWGVNIHRFIESLRHLKTQNQITEANIVKLLQPSTIPAGPTAPATLARNELPANLVPAVFTQNVQAPTALPAGVASETTLPRRDTPLGVSQASHRSEVRAEGQKKEEEEIASDILGSRRTLWFQDDIEGVDRLLLVEWARRKNWPYLRITLRNQNDLDRLKRTIRIEEGKVFREKGPLFKILEEGGILLIDYRGSDPKLVEGFNSLFDPKPYFEDVRDISEDLYVVGIMPEEQFDGHPVSFYTRYLRVRDHPVPEWHDPIKEITQRAPPEGFNGIVLDLYKSPETRDQVIGRFILDEKGAVGVKEGALLRAIQEDKPLLIRGGDWSQSDLAHIIRQALLTGQIYFNGEWIKVPDGFAQRIYTEEVDYSKEVRDKTIIAPEESKSKQPLWVINRDTQDILFERNRATEDGRYVRFPGLLEEEKQLHLKITDNLADWVWHQIMHSEAEVEIEVLPGVYVPKAYQALRSQRQRDATYKEEIKTLEEVQGEKSFLIEGEDETYILEKLSRIYPNEEILIYPVTPTTSIDQLTALVEITTEEEKLTFKSETKGVLEALQAGKTLVLTGLESNPGLRRDLETTLQSQPYLVVNGQRVELSDSEGGRLILVTAPEEKPYETGPQRVKMDPDGQEMKTMLRELYPNQFRATPDSFEKILELKKIFATIPAPSEPGRYPEKPNFDFSRLKLLYQYQYENWLEAFEDVFIADYREDPEVTAFMRTMVRVVFDIEEPGRQRDAIHGPKFHEVFNRTPGPLPWQRNVWQFIETLGVDLLKKADVGRDFMKPRSQEAFSLIQRALVNHHSGEKEEYYRALFDIKKNENVKDAPQIDVTAPGTGKNWQERKGRILRILNRLRLVMLKGSPGTGKSYITEEIGRELGYREGQIIGPITTGSDADEADLVGRRRLEGGRTLFFPEAVAKWASLQEGGLLIVDEANLTDPHFWNFLKGLTDDKPYIWINGRRQILTPRHRVIFTGNQETLTGRRFQKLLSRYTVTVRFEEFPADFLKERIREYLPEEVQDRENLVNLILELHQWFSRLDPTLSFSLRDVQELAARVHMLIGAEWTEEKVIHIAWSQYAPSLSPEKRLAAEHLIAYRYGILVREGVQEKIEALRTKHKDNFLDNGIVPVDSSLWMASLVDDFLAMRKARLEGRSKTPGKRGMIFEGPSGRGKDEVLKQTLRDAGLQFHSVTASMDYDEMIRVIHKAQGEGAIIIVSEMNLLPSGFLEGKLNDILTGKATEGFALFATINSADFSGRERLSTALQNRVLYVRMEDYSQEELLELARAKAPSVEESELKRLVNLHTWIRDEAGGVHRQPTTRELIRALQMMSEAKSREGREEAIREVYGPIFLQRILRGKSIPSDEELLRYREKGRLDNFKMLEEIINFIVPEALGPVELQLDASVPEDRGGYWQAGDGQRPSSITLRTSGVQEHFNLELPIHEASHGRFTRFIRFIAGLAPQEDSSPVNPLYQDLEDLRHMRALQRHFFPKARFNKPSLEELEISRLTQDGNAQGVIEWLDRKKGQRPLRLLFQTLLTAYVKNLVTKQQLSSMAKIMEGSYEVNPFALAEKHADNAKAYSKAVPETLSEEDIGLSQYRALQKLKEIEEDFLSIPEGGSEEEILPEPSREAQEEAIKKAREIMEDLSLLPQRDEEQKPTEVDPSEGLTQEEIARRRAALEKKREELLKTTETEVRKELGLMEEDLSWRGGVTTKRLQEIKDQLTDPKHPRSLVNKIRQLNNEEINRRVQSILNGVEERIKRSIQLTQITQSGWWGWLQGIGARVRRVLLETAGGTEKPRGARYPSKSAPPQSLAHRKETRHRPQPARPPEPMPIKAPLTTKESVLRDPWMREVTQNHQSELDQALSNFFYQKLDPNKIYGSMGTLDIDRFLETGDPAVSHRRSGGRLEQQKKEIILVSSPGQFHKSLIFTELFHFLFSQGFQVTVYVSQNQYVEGIRTVGDLRQVLDQASLDVRPSDIRKPSGNYEIIDVQELQRKVEALYLYGAFRLAHAEKLVQPLSFNKQVEKLKQVLWENGIAADRVWEDKEEGFIGLDLSLLPLKDDTLEKIVQSIRHLDLPDLREVDLSWTQITDKGLEHLSKLTNLKAVNLSWTQITDKGLEHLLKLKDLKEVTLSGTGINDEDIHSFITSHPNKKGLVVYNAEGRPIAWANVNVSEEHRKKPLSLDEQFEKLKQVLWENGIDADCAWKDEEEGFIGLDLSLLPLNDDTLEKIVQSIQHLQDLKEVILDKTQITNTGLQHLSKLQHLREVSLVGVQGITDEGLKHLSKLKNLKVVNLSFTQITDKGLEHLLNLEDLEEVSLSGTQITDEGLKHLSKLKNLKVVSLSGTQITDEGLEHLLDLKNLERLYLFGTHITDDGISSFLESHPNKERLVVFNAEGRLIEGKEEPRSQTDWKEDPVGFLKALILQLVDRETTFKIVRQRFAEEGKAEWFKGVMNSLGIPEENTGIRSEVRQSLPGTMNNEVAEAVVNALHPQSSKGLTPSQVHQVYKLSTADLDSLIKAVLETWDKRRQEQTEKPIEDVGIAQAAMNESNRLIEHLRLLRESRTLPQGTITVGLRLTAQNNTSFLTQLFKVLQDESQNIEVLAEADVVKNLPSRDSSHVAVRPVPPRVWKQGLPALRSDQENVPVALDTQFMGEQMEGMFNGIVLHWGTAKPQRLVEDFGELLFAVTLVEMAKIFADPEHKKELARREADLKTKADYLKTQLLERLPDLGYPPEMFSFGANGYLTIEGAIAVAFLEMKAQTEIRKAA